MAFVNATWWECSDEEYYASKRLGSTSLARAIGVDGPSGKTGDIGRARHIAVFQPDLLATSIAVKPAEVLRGSGKGQETRLAAWEAENAGKIHLTELEHHQIVNLATAIEEHPAAGKLLRHSRARFELPMRFDDEATGLELRGKLDAFLLGRIFDLKGSRDPDLDSFEWSIFDYGYHLQAALYLDAVTAITGEEGCFVWIVVSSAPPYRIAVYECGPEWLERGRKVLRCALDIIHKTRQLPRTPLYYEARPLLANSPPPKVDTAIARLEAFAREYAR